MIERGSRQIPISRQAELLGISRASIYYKPTVKEENIELMRIIDEQYTKTPFYGSRRMTKVLKRKGYEVNRKRIQRLMRVMGIEAIYPRPRLSKPEPEDKIYPYLLKGIDIIRANQVWGADITYIRVYKGWLYLIAIMDWFSRYIVGFSISTFLDVDFCIDALDKALSIAKPEIFNTDQGSQFTSKLWTESLR